MYRGALDCELVASEKDMAALSADCGRASGRAGSSLVVDRTLLIQSVLNRLGARRAKLWAALSAVQEKQLQRLVLPSVGKPSALENPRFDRISSGRSMAPTPSDRERDQWARDGPGDPRRGAAGGYEEAALRRRHALERLDLLRNHRLPAQDDGPPDAFGALGGERERAERAAQQQATDCLALLESQWENVRGYRFFIRFAFASFVPFVRSSIIF